MRWRDNPLYELIQYRLYQNEFDVVGVVIAALIDNGVSAENVIRRTANGVNLGIATTKRFGDVDSSYLLAKSMLEMWEKKNEGIYTIDDLDDEDFQSVDAKSIAFAIETLANMRENIVDFTRFCNVVFFNDCGKEKIKTWLVDHGFLEENGRNDA